MADAPGLLERLDAGPVICAEGYLFELERRGYLQAGAFVPEVVLEHPEKVAELHREFVHAGSDVVEAFTYYAHREKLRIIGREHLLERDQPPGARARRGTSRARPATLLAGNVCNTNVYDPATRRATTRPRRCSRSRSAGRPTPASTSSSARRSPGRGEALRRDSRSSRRPGLPAVVTLALHQRPGHARRAGRRRGVPRARGRRRRRRRPQLHPRARRRCCRCSSEIREAVSCHVAALPVPYRTHAAEPTLPVAARPGARAPDAAPSRSALDPFTCTRHEIARLHGARRSRSASTTSASAAAPRPHHIRAMAEALGRTPPASRYSADMSKHAYLGTDPTPQDRVPGLRAAALIGAVDVPPMMRG